MSADNESMPAGAEDLRDLDVQGDGQSAGVPAAGQHEGHSYSPSGGPGLLHWQESTITQPGIGDRGNVFFAAIEMTRMAMVLTDPNQPDNPIVFANRAFQDLTGYTQEEIVGRNCRFLQGAQTDRQPIQEIHAAVEEHRAISAEILNYKRDGTPFWNALFIAPVFNTDGKLLYFFASQLDVTRRRTSEQAMRQAQKMEAIGQLTAGLAHDFNNLLQVISGNLDLARSRSADERLRRPLENASAAAERGAKLTKQLLAFARKTRLEPKPTNLNALLVEFGEVLNATTGGQVTLDFNLRPSTPNCMVDPVHLEMAVLNVLINARDAMPEGGAVTISTAPLLLDGNAPAFDLPPGQYVTLSIADQGEGMAPHVLEHATEPFFTTKEQGKGTGLGLAMVQGFVQQSLGRLEITSEQGRGTTVRMIFPSSAQVAVMQQGAVAQAGLSRQEAGSQTATILVVEDVPDVLELAVEHLTGLGYRVLTATNANEALAVIEQQDRRIDLLFTDLVMPGSMNGLVLAGRVRERLPDVAILLTTGYNEELLADGPNARGWDVLGKPYRHTELADRVRAALNSRDRVAPRLYERRSTGPAHEG